MKKDFVSDSDHEDYEREYYDRKNSGGLFGCLFLTGILILIILISIIIKLIN